MTTQTSKTSQSADETDTIKLSGMGYHFSAAGVSQLKADAYCLAVGAVDVSGSMDGEEQKLSDCFGHVLEACDKAPNRDAILFRLTQFNEQIRELRGFVLPANAPRVPFQTGGMTALGAACVDAFKSVEAYAEHLLAQGDYQSNGIVFVLTDGEETVEDEDHAIARVKAEIDRIRKSEKLNSLIAILVGFRPEPATEARQQRFARETGMLYVKLADATPQRLAKFAKFVSQSTSSQSRQAGSKQAATITVPPDLSI